MGAAELRDVAMKPLIMTNNPPAIRRWCEECGRFTRSRMSDFGAAELCAEHEEPDEDDGPDWIDDDDDDE